MQRLAALAVLVPWLAGCAATVRTTSTTRIEHVQSAFAPSISTVRVAPVATLSAGRHPDAASLELAPELMEGGMAGERLRARARWSDPGALHPSVSASIEEGTTRTSELLGDSIGPVPAAATLRARQLSGGASVRLDRGRRLHYAATVDLARSQGLGTSASQLPQLSSTAFEARTAWNATRHLVVGAALRTGSERVGSAAPLAITSVRAALQWNPTKSMDLSVASGLVATRNGIAPSLELAARHGMLPTDVRLAATITRRPEVDRLSGALNDRWTARVRVETPLVPHVSFGGTLQESSDLGGMAQRVVRSATAGLVAEFGRRIRLETGVARFQQYTGGISTNAETRTYLQFTFAPNR